MAEQDLTAVAPAVDRRAFIEELEGTAELAAERAGGFQDHYFEVAGETVKIRFAGSALVAALTPALAHARIAPVAAPGLTVRAWDDASSETGLPATPWGKEDYREHGVIRGFFDEEVRAVYQLDCEALSLFEPPRRAGLFWAREGKRLPFYERSSPLRTLLHLWLDHRDRQLTHAAALGDRDGCVLLPGPGGAGKSSTALACLSSSIGFLADDFCILEPGDPPIIHALYSSAKAHTHSFERLGLPASLIANRVRELDEKAVSFLHDHMPEKILARAPLCAILVPRITGERDTRVVPISAAAALTALAPTSMLMLPGPSARSLRRLAAAVRAVPCHRFELGTDPEQVPAAIERLLGR